jgi:hypothetical protein
MHIHNDTSTAPWSLGNWTGNWTGSGPVLCAVGGELIAEGLLATRVHFDCARASEAIFLNRHRLGATL